jgi:hypothetical protein
MAFVCPVKAGSLWTFATTDRQPAWWAGWSIDVNSHPWLTSTKLSSEVSTPVHCALAGFRTTDRQPVPIAEVVPEACRHADL